MKAGIHRLGNGRNWTQESIKIILTPIYSHLFPILDPADFPLQRYDPPIRPGLWHRQMPGDAPKPLQNESSKKKKKAAK